MYTSKHRDSSGSAGIKRDAELSARSPDPSPLPRYCAAVALCKHRRQRPAVGGAQPQAQQVPLLIWLLQVGTEVPTCQIAL